MIERGQISHDKHTERRRELFDRGVVSMSEIISYGNRTPVNALNAFIGSYKHKQALDNKNFNYCGICVKPDEKGRKYYAVILFEI